MTDDELLRTIQDARVHGALLGDLIRDYGADAVVQALGVMGVAHILGLDDPLDEHDTYDEGE